MLERRGGRGPAGQAQIEGIVVHALADGLARGVSRAELVAETDEFLNRQTQLPPWLLARTRRALTAMLDAAIAWQSANYPGRTLVGSELKLSAKVPVLPSDAADGHLPSTRPVVLEGRVDRLDRRADGSVVVVDFKTGATKPTKAQVLENAQLAVYQLALELTARIAGRRRTRPPAHRQTGRAAAAAARAGSSPGVERSGPRLRGTDGRRRRRSPGRTVVATDARSDPAARCGPKDVR